MGRPVEVMFVDLQATTLTSLAVDLNYFMYSSMNGNVRKFNLKDFLDTYYQAFNDVLHNANQKMPFTFQQLYDEFMDKNVIGFMIGLMITPIMLIESDEVSDYVEGEDIEEFFARSKEKALEQIDSNPLLEPRFISILNDMIDSGFVSKNK